MSPLTFLSNWSCSCPGCWPGGAARSAPGARRALTCFRLAAKAPSLRQALEKATDLGLAYLILDGTIVAADRCAEKKVSRKGREIDRWYSG